MRRFLGFTRVGAALLLSLTIGAAPAFAQPGPGGPGNPDVEGTWMFNVTPGGGFPPPFLAMITFGAGGGLVETETDAQITGQGTWQEKPGNTVSFTLVQFEFTNGVWDGTFVATGTLKYDPAKRTLKGPFTVSFYDTSNNLLFSAGGSSLTGSRIPPK
ncbi:MAG: hypothetical protein ACRD1V_04925 [Vicinamibacterales bacterium]